MGNGGQFGWDLQTKDFSRFVQLKERFPLAGKIEVFKMIYINEFYYPALQKTIGNKVDWKPLETFPKLPVFKKTMLLSSATCNVKAKIDNKVALWNSLLQMKANNVDTGRLNIIPFDTATNFMKVERDYAAIVEEGEKVDDNLRSIYADYEKTTIEETKKKADQLPIIKIEPEHKKVIENIITTGKFPEQPTLQLINAINKLFIDIKIVHLKKEELANQLFKSNELLTLSQIREAIYNLQEKLERDYKGKEVRFKTD